MGCGESWHFLSTDGAPRWGAENHGISSPTDGAPRWGAENHGISSPTEGITAMGCGETLFSYLCTHKWNQATTIFSIPAL